MKIIAWIGLISTLIISGRCVEVEFNSDPLPKVLDCGHGHAEVIGLPMPQDCNRYNVKPVAEEPLLISGSLWELDERRFYVRGYGCIKHTLTKKCTEGFFGTIWQSEWVDMSVTSLTECQEAPVRSDPEIFAYECYYMTTKEVSRSWIEKVPFQSSIDHQTGEIYLNSVGTSVDVKLGQFLRDSYLFYWNSDNIGNFDPLCNHVKIKDIQQMVITIENSTLDSILKINIPEEYLLYYLTKEAHVSTCTSNDIQTQLYQTTSGQYMSFSRNISDIWNTTIDRAELSEKYSESRGGEAFLGALVDKLQYKSVNERYYKNCLSRNQLIQTLTSNQELTTAELEILTNKPNCVGKIRGKELQFSQCDYLTISHYEPDIYSNLRVKVNGTNNWVYYDPWKQQVVQEKGVVMSLGTNRVVTFANSVTINLKTNKAEEPKETPYKPLYKPEYRMMRLRNASTVYNKLDNVTIWTSFKNTTTAVYESGWKYMFNNPLISHVKNMLHVVHWVQTLVNTFIWIIIIRFLLKMYWRLSPFRRAQRIIMQQNLIQEE